VEAKVVGVSPSPDPQRSPTQPDPAPAAETVATVIADLLAEQRALDAIVEPLADDAWDAPTPSPGWAVRDQIGHLLHYDDKAALAITDPDRFAADRDAFVAHLLADPSTLDEVTLAETRALRPRELLARWRAGRQRLADAASTCGEGDRIQWYGPPMSAKSFLTARLMECWAHGYDVCDTLDTTPEPTDRLRHITRLGFLTRGWTYRNRGLEIPDGEVRLDLAAPSGQRWTLGPDEAEASVTGSALEFCLVTSQRRNVADTDLVVEGTLAHDWLNKAQLFAGPATDPPPPQGEPVTR
jgi:uncharacterized protein (TIGR03084 family)